MAHALRGPTMKKSTDPPSMTAVLATKAQIDAYRAKVLLSGLKLECLGMKRNGPSIYSIVKREYSLKGNRQSVYNQLSAILANT